MNNIENNITKNIFSFGTSERQNFKQAKSNSPDVENVMAEHITESVRIKGN